MDLRMSIFFFFCFCIFCILIINNGKRSSLLKIIVHSTTIAGKTHIPKLIGLSEISCKGKICSYKHI